MQHDWEWHRRRDGRLDRRLRHTRWGWLVSGPVAAVLLMAGSLGAAVGLIPALWLEEPARASVTVTAAAGAAAPGAISARFGLCDAGDRDPCVIDGDTIRLGGAKIRIADIDTPETHPPRCAEEARLGWAATLRMQALLSAGPFVLEAGERDRDRYGQLLCDVTRGGESLSAGR